MHQIKIISIILCFLAVSSLYAQQLIIPETVTDVIKPVISLNGTWKFFSPSNNEQESSEIKVPGEPYLQNKVIQFDIPFYYQTEFFVPADYAKKAIFLKFTSIYGNAKVWVNDKVAGHHQGGFTSWFIDITDKVEAGQNAKLKIELIDKKNDISYASVLAQHPIAGILGDVHLIARSKAYIGKLQFVTDFDEKYQNAKVIFRGFVSKPEQKEYSIEFKLLDQKGNDATLPIALKADKKDFSYNGIMPIENPLKWDAEHPNLYKLEVTLLEGRTVVESFETSLGFREIEFKDQQLFVNGIATKLRGITRNQVHPLAGRTHSLDFDKQDILAAKEANINFIHCSYFPPSEDFVRLCDETGIFVMETAPLCNIGIGRQAGFEVNINEVEIQIQISQQINEMIMRDVNNPSVLFWSLGRNCINSLLFQQKYIEAKKLDQSRFMTFDFAGKTNNIKSFDFISLQNPNSDGSAHNEESKIINFSDEDYPVLFDHLSPIVYSDRTTLANDPNIRNFWAENVQKTWNEIYNSKAMGGAISSLVDEVFIIGDSAVGDGQCGIKDIWRRNKPEYFLLKKIYSPLRFNKCVLNMPVEGANLELPVSNRFSTTNLNEISFEVSLDKDKITIKGSDIRPGKDGFIYIPAMKWNNQSKIQIKAIDINKNIIDEEVISFTEFQSVKAEKKIKIKEKSDEHALNVQMGSSTFIFDKKTARLLLALSGKDTMFYSNPQIRVSYLSDIKENHTYMFKTMNLNPDQFEYKTEKLKDGFILKGAAKSEGVLISIEYKFLINNQLEISYQIDNMNFGIAPNEIGIEFRLPSDYTKIKWERNAQFLLYPNNHIGRPEGEANIFGNKPSSKNKFQILSWDKDCREISESMDMYKNRLLYIPFDAAGSKSNINKYQVLKESGKSLSIYSSGKTACRIGENSKNGISLFVHSYLDYPTISIENNSKSKWEGKFFSGIVKLKFED